MSTAYRLIREIQVTPSVIQSGESVEVTVVPHSAWSGDQFVIVNGARGPHQHFQFSGASGIRYITVIAGEHGEVVDQAVLTVRVNARKGAAVPRIELKALGHRMYAATLVSDPHAPIAKHDLSASYQLGVEGSLQSVQLGQMVRIPSSVTTSGQPSGATHDGSSATHTNIEIVLKGGGISGEVRKTFSIMNPDEFSRANGIIRLPMQIAISFGAGDPGSGDRDRGEAGVQRSLLAKCTVTNTAPEEIRLKRYVVQLVRDAETSADGAYSIDAIDISLVAGASHVRTIELPAALFETEFYAFAVYCEGETCVPESAPQRLRAISSWYTLVRYPLFNAQRVEDEATLAKLRAARTGMLPNVPFSITAEQLANMGVGLSSSSSPTLSGSATPSEGIDHPVVNTPIELRNVTRERNFLHWHEIARSPLPNEAYHYIEEEFVYTPTQILNARKGDVLLSPVKGDLISKLLTHIGQEFAHSGIMVSDHDHLRHCTAAEDRDNNTKNLAFPPTGLKPDVILYGWPGTITQTVEDAFRNTLMKSPDPDPKDPSGFAYYSINVWDFEISDRGVNHALVIKPFPSTETPVMRRLMHRVADEAKAIDGYYDFYGYTRPVDALTEANIAPQKAGWAAGMLGLVCSSFVWLSAKRAGLNLEGPGMFVVPSDLEPLDVQRGAAVKSNTIDGLYNYSQATRLSALKYLKNEVFNAAHAAMPKLLPRFLKKWISDGISNQMCNTFAANDPSVYWFNHDRWSDTVDANAVSPNNIMWWDGIYGYFEFVLPVKAAYHAVRVFESRPVINRGDIRGIVRTASGPVNGVLVTIVGSGAPACAVEVNGEFRFHQIPEGCFLLRVESAAGSGAAMNETVIEIDSKTPNELDILLGAA